MTKIVEVDSVIAFFQSCKNIQKQNWQSF